MRETTDESKKKKESSEEGCGVFPLQKVQINEICWTFSLVDELACHVFPLSGPEAWSAPLPLPWSQMGGCAALGSGCTVTAGQSCILQEWGWGCWTKHSQWSVEGGGGEAVAAGWKSGSWNGGSKGGTKERQGTEAVDQHWGWSERLDGCTLHWATFTEICFQERKDG